MSQRVLIIGGGLAGLAAATVLAPKGFQVTILEARPRLGGRASSFTDAATGQLIDNCQHVAMGCCTAFSRFCRTVGIDHLLTAQPALYFMTPDGRMSRWRVDFLPPPLHLARSFLKAHFVSWSDKLRILRGLIALVRHADEDDPPLMAWLQTHGQTPRTIERFWSVVLTSALNETPDRLGLRYARKVFLDAFLRSRNGGTVFLPNVPLARLYGQELQAWLKRHKVAVRLNEGVRRLHMENGQGVSAELRTGERLTADWFISAVPHDRVAALLPAEMSSRRERGDAEECRDPSLRSSVSSTSSVSYTSHPFSSLESSPITSVHLWYDRPIMTLPHVVLVGCQGQWVFNRGEGPPGEHGIQVVISASRQFDDMKNEEVGNLITKEIGGLFRASSDARLIRVRTVTERSATFSAKPGVDHWRPAQTTTISNLFLAGDWTQTGWPATMESAVRSGHLAAEALVRSQESGVRGQESGIRLSDSCFLTPDP